MTRLLVVVVLTAVIHMVNTLIYSVRVAGVNTGRLATAYSLFNVVFLVSSTANMIQGPLLATIVEGVINRGAAGELQLSPLTLDMRYVIGSATLGTLLGALLIPSFVNIFTRLILVFERVGSVPGMFLLLFLSPSRLKRLLGEIKLPPRGMLKRAREPVSGLPTTFLLLNVAVTGIFTTGVLSALYAGALYPEYRTSATLLSSIVNGVAQVLFATVVDPTAARITDQALRGERSQADVKRMSFYLAATRLAGTLLAQLIFLPAAYFIRYIAILIT